MTTTAYTTGDRTETGPVGTLLGPWVETYHAARLPAGRMPAPGQFSIATTR